MHDLDIEMQQAIDSTNTVSWRNWAQEVDTSIGNCESTRPLEYILGVIGDLYCKRRLAEFGAQLENGALELDDVMAQFEEILHGANGEGTFRDAFRVKKLADMSRELPARDHPRHFIPRR